MSINNLVYSAKGLALTEQFEGCSLAAYQDQVGVWTIGYGHTGIDVKQGMTITTAEAEELLARDVERAAACVNRVVSVRLTQEEFDALTDFVFNLGAGAFSNSSMLRQLNAGDFSGASAQFARWDRAGGAAVAGLLRRRLAEAALFKSDSGSTQLA